jgi:hypothetical protein
MYESGQKLSESATLKFVSMHIMVRIGSGFSDLMDSDPDPYWDPDPGARKLRHFSEKMHFLVIFYKNFTTKKVQNSTIF